MKKLLVSATVGAAFALTPAIAQTPDAQPPLEEAQADSATEEGLVEDSTMTASLPDEVREVVESGDYTSEDLAAAQLAAIESAADNNR